MDHQTLKDSYRILARERSHEEARQTVTTNRMLVQSLVIINGAAATAVLAYCGAHGASGAVKPATLLTMVLYCLGVFTAIFAGLYVRRTTQEGSSYWESFSLVPTRTAGKKPRKGTDNWRTRVNAGRPGCLSSAKSSFSPPVYVLQSLWDSKIVISLCY